MAEYDGSYLGLDNRPAWFVSASVDNRPHRLANPLLFSYHPWPSGNFWTYGLSSEQVSPSLLRLPGPGGRPEPA